MICKDVSQLPEGKPEKISKSRVTGCFFLGDCDINPFPFLANLTARMMLPSKFSGPLKHVRNMDNLRRWTALADLNPYPKPLYENEHLDWSVRMSHEL